MLELFLWWLLAAFVFVIGVGVVGYLVARWLFIGFLADIWFKANDRNAELMRAYLTARR